MDRDTFVAKARAQLTNWNADLAGLRAELELADGPNREKLQAQIDKFLAERKAADALLDKISTVNSATWAAMSGKVETAWQALEQKFNLVRN